MSVLAVCAFPRRTLFSTLSAKVGKGEGRNKGTDCFGNDFTELSLTFFKSTKNLSNFYKKYCSFSSFLLFFRFEEVRRGGEIVFGERDFLRKMRPEVTVRVGGGVWAGRPGKADEGGRTAWRGGRKSIRRLQKVRGAKKLWRNAEIDRITPVADNCNRGDFL